MNAAGHGSVSGGARGLLTQYLEPVGYDAACGLDNIVFADVCLLSVSIETAGRVFTELTPAALLFPRVKWSLIFLVAAGNQHIPHDLILVEQ